MSENYLGSIRAFPFGVVPRGWMACNGQLLSIAQNQALFSLLKTAYGGDGIQTFGLPNLQGTFMVGQGTSPMGQTGGEAFHVLNASEMPAHTHLLIASGATATLSSPLTAFPGVAPGGGTPYTQTPNTTMSSSVTGANAAHENRPPFLALNLCIAIVGTYPSPS